jgi:superfamily II DNA or RNA helicase
LNPGICEQVLNKLISKEIDSSSHIVETGPIDNEEAAKILSKYLAEVIEQGLANIKDNGGKIADQITLCNRLIDTIVASAGDAVLADMSVDRRAKMLLALLERQNSAYAVNEKLDIIRPVTSIAASSLFTGSIYEPSMFSELKKEILSCDRIDMLVSFIKWSGLRIIVDQLREFTMQGRLRIITTSYMGATDVKAVEVLRGLPNTEIKISYETKRTRLHAKAYVFYRNNGFTTAYVGSSNLSNAAISAGLEWNVKLTNKDQPDTIKKIEATFETYWNDKEFVPYDEGEKQVLQRAIMAERHTSGEYSIFSFDITPYPYQNEILDRLEAERKIHDHWRNLIVAATGTGKTVISAFDYKKFCSGNRGKPSRLLFVAHREEILKQSLSCFRTVMRDPNFGELFVGGCTPDSIEHLFISIQTFNSRELDNHTTPEFYDYIIVDEFHHAAAPIYQKLLTYYNPKILLGLTATPERMDGKSVLEYFNNRIAAEIRLPEAIERRLLCPFQYFGVTDTVDLESLRWTRGGYDKGELNNLFTGNDARAKHVRISLDRYVTDINEVKGLGFCVSIEHAGYMAGVFNRYSIPSIALSALSSDDERNNAKKRLISGEIRFIFVVDLYNEGVDIPEINTILFLRPTESLTVFLQQLGRGLRLQENKDCLTVLDFIGQANRKYNFEDKFKALLLNTTRGIQRDMKEGFSSLPKGCFIQLEKKAGEYILNNIRSAFGRVTGLVAKLASFEEDTGERPTLSRFLEHYHLVAREFYSKTSFSRLSVLSEIRDDFRESDEILLEKALARICTIDSRRWVQFLLKILPVIETMDESVLTVAERKMLLMFHYTIWQKPLPDYGFNTITESMIRMKQNKVMFGEIMAILQYCYKKIDFVDEPVDLGFDSPLDLHCTYTRDQILAAANYYTMNRMPSMREGVKFLPDKNLDIFLITLNKADKQYSPSTMYNDYSINEWLFHWQSQSTTAEYSSTGQRYIHHRQSGSQVALFVREFKNDAAGASPYTFLGLAQYLQHTGSRPMSIVWKLLRPIPAKFLKKTNKMIVG